jgi:hypothetical protein
MRDATAFLERLAAEPKRFVTVGYWRHSDEHLERRERAPQPRRSQCENEARNLARYIGKLERLESGDTVTLERVAVESVA